MKQKLGGLITSTSQNWNVFVLPPLGFWVNQSSNYAVKLSYFRWIFGHVHL